MAEVVCIGKNLYIEKKKSQSFQKLEIKSEKIYIDGKEILLKKQIYACLHYDKFRNITFIVRKEENYSATFIFEEEKCFKEFLDIISKELQDIKISEQNKKINGYASALVAKLQEGVETEIFDNKDEEDILCCSVCGMQCDPNIPYCMECGASV